VVGQALGRVWEPKKVNDNWFGPYDLLYDVGDIDLDGVGDICSYNAPWVTFYRGGDHLDSLIDAMVDCRVIGWGADDRSPSIVRLGDIDGSGVETIAVGGEGVVYIKPTSEVSETGIYRLLPDGTGVAGTPEMNRDGAGEMNLSILRPGDAGHSDEGEVP
jgi:hypothetical protein